MHEKIREYAKEMLTRDGLGLGDLEVSEHVIPEPTSMKDVMKGATILADIIKNKDGDIVLNRDYDLDGILSGAINYSMLAYGMGVPEKRIKHIQNKRIWGNGFNDKAVKLLKYLNKSENGVDVMITSDHGSNDEERYREIKDTIGTTLIITDHHLISERGIPTSVDAFINPQQPGCPYSKNISGGVTTYYLMVVTAVLLEMGGYRRVDWDAIDDVAPMLALTTLCDQMNMLDKTNRKLVNDGLRVLNTSNDVRWRTVRKFLKSDKITDTNLSFKLGPMINSTGRLGVPMVGFEFFVHQGDDKRGKDRLNMLNHYNDIRKKLQGVVYKSVEKLATRLIASDSPTKNALVIRLEPHFDENGDSIDLTSISGPMASKLVEKYNVSAIILSGEGNDLKGSCRARKSVHIKNALDRVNKTNPNILLKYGGHEGAAGVTVDGAYLDELRNLLDTETYSEIKTEELVINVDETELDLGFVQDIEALGPFGNGWKQPSLTVIMEVSNTFQIVNGTMSIVNFTNGMSGLMMVGKDYPFPTGPAVVKCRTNIVQKGGRDDISMFVEDFLFFES